MIGYIWTRESNVYDKERYSIKAQLDACREAAHADGVAITREYQVQFSGRDLFAIPELNELRELIKTPAGEQKIIYCYKQDRLVRGEEAIDIFYLLVDFRRQNTEVRFVKDPVDHKSIVGQVMLLFGGFKSSTEIKDIKERTMDGKRLRVQEGKLWGLGRDKFGYHKDREQGIAEIVEPEAETIKRIFEEVCSGKGLMTVARDLNRDGVPTSFAAKGERKSKWHPATVRVLLRDPAYKGEVWAYRYGGDAYRMPDGLFPAIVAAEVWDQAQSRLESNRGEKQRNLARPSLLRGLIFCRECGARMYPAKQHGVYYYRCSSEFLSRHRNETRTCAGKSARADRLESEIWDRVVWLISNPDQLIAALDLARTTGIVEQLQSRLNLARVQIEQKGAEQERLARRLRKAEGRVAVLIESEIRQLEAERDSLQNEFASLSSQLHDQQAWRVGADQVYEICSQLTTSSPPTFEQKRSRLETLRIAVIASGRRWQIGSMAFLSNSKSLINKTYSVLAKKD